MSYTIFGILQDAGLKRQDVLALEPEDLVRLEKQLKLEQKKRANISMNQLEKLLDALKNDLGTLKIFYKESMLYNLFHHLPFNEGNSGIFYMEEELRRRVREFFLKYLEEDVFEHFQTLFSENELEKLAEWRNIYDLLPLAFRQTFHRFLFGQMEFMLETLNQRPVWYKLRSAIPFAKSKYFYQWLSMENDPECVKLLYEVLKFYKQNSDYTKGRDFTDSILVAMYDYSSDTGSLSAMISVVAFKHGGSNKVAFLAFLVIAGISVLLVTLLMSRVGGSGKKSSGKVQPRDEFMEKFHRANWKNMHKVRKRQATIMQGTDCNSALNASDRNTPGSGKEYVYWEEKSLLTGANLMEGGYYFYDIHSSGKDVRFENRTDRDILLSVFMTTCHYKEFDQYKYMECPNGFAMNRVYIKARETLSIDYHFDSVAVQTGGTLYGRESSNPMSKKPKYAFCPVTAVDSVLYMTGMVFKGNAKAVNGVLSIEKKAKSYLLTWNGKEKVAYNGNTKKYLMPGKTMEIKYSRRKR